MKFMDLRKRDYAFLFSWACYVYFYWIVGFGGRYITIPKYLFGKYYLISYYGLDYQRTLANPGPTLFQFLPLPSKINQSGDYKEEQ